MRKSISLTDGNRILEAGGDILSERTTGGFQRLGYDEVLFTSHCEVYIFMASSWWSRISRILYLGSRLIMESTGIFYGLLCIFVFCQRTWASEWQSIEIIK